MLEANSRSREIALRWAVLQTVPFGGLVFEIKLSESLVNRSVRVNRRFLSDPIRDVNWVRKDDNVNPHDLDGFISISMEFPTKNRDIDMEQISREISVPARSCVTKPHCGDS